MYGRRHDSISQRHHCGDGFKSPGGSEWVAGHGLCRRYVCPTGLLLTECQFERAGFALVVHLSAGAVGVDVEIVLSRLVVCLLQGIFYRP